MSGISALSDRYINPLTDFGFKRIFGTEINKALLIDFLNVILPPQHHVKDLTYRNTENLGNTPIDRKAIFDLYCESKSGEKFIVEMQKAKHDYFKDRSVYYATFPIQEQAKKGEWNYKLKAVYTIGILDFIFRDHQDDPTLLHIVELKDQECRVFYDKLKFIYIELPKFTKTIDELQNHFEQWLFVLKHLPDLEYQPSSLQDNVFKQLFDTAQITNLSQEDRQAYENSLKYYRDMVGVVETARREGIQKGRQQGIEQGIQQGIQQGIEQGIQQGIQQGIEQGRRSEKVAIAQAMKIAGNSDELIMQVTGLSLEDLEGFSGTDYR